MKKLILLLISIVGLCFVSCGSSSSGTDSSASDSLQSSAKETQTKSSASEGDSSKQESRSTDKSTLVIYFSRTGNTEKIAKYLIELTGADSYVIEAAEPYTDDDIHYQDDNCRANKEQNDKSVRPKIADPIKSIDSYDTIFLGYPIWWGEEPRIIDTFLESYDFSDKTVIAFCTSGSSGIATSEKNIADLVKIGKQLEGKRFAADASKDEVKEWFESLPLNDEKSESKLLVSVNGKELTASFADSTAAKELAEKLKEAPVTVKLEEYGGFEKDKDFIVK